MLTVWHLVTLIVSSHKNDSFLYYTNDYFASLPTVNSYIFNTENSKAVTKEVCSRSQVSDKDVHTEEINYTGRTLDK